MPLEAVLNAQSVAVIGASKDVTKRGYQTVNTLLEDKYAGKIYPVNPKEKSILGLPCYAKVTDIEGPVDLLFCNHEEARALTGKHDAIDCAHEIHQHAENVALTLGENGSLLMHDGESIPIEGVSVDAVDTTGAGDMYAAGILYGITNGLSWKRAGHLASHASARIVSQLGARLQNPFSPQELQQLLDETP